MWFVFLLTNLNCSVLFCVVGILLVLFLAKIFIMVVLESISCSNFWFTFCRYSMNIAFSFTVSSFLISLFDFLRTYNCSFMNNLIASFSVYKVFIWSFIKLSSLQKSVSLNNCAVCEFFGDFNGSVKGVSGGIVEEIFDGTFGDSKDPVDGSRGVFDKVNGGGFSVGTRLSTCSYT